MTEFEQIDVSEDLTLPDEVKEVFDDTVHGTDDCAISSDEGVPSENWEKRCLAAEAALEDSLEFAVMYAAEGGGLADAESMRENATYQRFCELRALGLSVKEAFCAADSARAKKPLPPAAKDHLRSSHTRLAANTTRLTGEELTIAKSLLGDDYSADELLKLYRRVAK